MFLVVFGCFPLVSHEVLAGLAKFDGGEVRGQQLIRNRLIRL